MRLVKLLAYSLLGYVLYELYLGMTEGAAAAPASSRAPSRAGAKAKTVTVEDSGGGRSTRSVGRGAVR
jgi:hypothetical protein